VWLNKQTPKSTTELFANPDMLGENGMSWFLTLLIVFLSLIMTSLQNINHQRNLTSLQ
jgi:hypothetical protein